MRFWLFMELLLLFSRAAEAAGAFTVSLIVPYENLDEAIATVPKFKMNHFNPQAIEFFEKEILVTSEEYLGKQVFPRKIDGVEAEAYLLVTFDGNTQDEIDAIVEQAAELVLEAGALDVLVADTPAKMKDAWAARSSFLEGIEEQTKLLDECDVVVPVTKIPDYVIFADEPTGNLDSKTTVEVMEMICGFARDFHQTIILVTHDPEMARYADRIVTLIDGEIVREEVKQRSVQ